MSPSRWLMKAEPDSRIVKGKDVKFSVGDFEALGTTAWEGVRNHEAKNLMKSMKVGDQVLFYHSNCKNPGVAAFAEVCKEAYPDHTAWDPDHPYYDAKTDQANPRWYMVDLQFKSRAKHLVPLSLIKRIAAVSVSGSGLEEVTEELGVGYLGEEGVKGIKAMPLVNRGRLSVQRVDEDAWEAISVLAERGGWDEGGEGGSKGGGEKKVKGAGSREEKSGRGKRENGKGKTKAKQEDDDADADAEGERDDADADADGEEERVDDDEENEKQASAKRPRRSAAKRGITSQTATTRRAKSRKTRAEETAGGDGDGGGDGDAGGDESSDLTELSDLEEGGEGGEVKASKKTNDTIIKANSKSTAKPKRGKATSTSKSTRVASSSSTTRMRTTRSSKRGT